MPFSDTIQHLDARIRATVEKTVTDLRQELLERLQSQSQQLREQVEALAPELPEVFLPSEDIDAVLAEAAADERERARGGAIREVKTALTQLDAARSQADILGILLTETGRHASRTAVFLAEPGRLRGWGGHGFAEAEERLRGFVLEGEQAASVGRIHEGRGVVRMSSADRIRLSSELEISVPGEALLIPLVLRDRIAGALYADRLEDAELDPEVLQILTHIASLALETLPLRQRPSTPTLHFEDEDALSGRLPVWGTAASAAAPPAEEVAAEPATEAPAEEVAPPAAAPEPPVEMEAQEPAVQEPEVGETVAAESFEDAGVELEEIETGGPDFAISVGDDQAAGETEPEEVAAFGDFEAEAPVPPVEGPAAEAAFGATEPAVEPEAEVEEVAAGAPPEAGVEADTGELEVELEEDIAAQPLPELETPPAPPAPAPVSEIRPAGVASQVQPPSDVQGPGWAFNSESQRDSDEEARHQEAQRLARLLVSEIKLYNEEQVNEGRRNNDIFERLKEDIERSRQLYESRVDERVRESTDYFYQEMVRVLGAGDPKTLGI